jgi:hypothetical protein
VNPLNRYPKIGHLILGFGLGMSVAALNGMYGQQTIEEFKQIADAERARYERTIADNQKTIKTLTNEVSKLKTDTRKVTTVSPDGTRHEVFEQKSERDAVTNSDQDVKSQTRVVTDAKSIEHNRTETESKKVSNRLHLYLEYDQTYQWSVGVAYPLWGPIVGHGSMSIQGFGTGWALGLGIIL